MGKFEKHKYLRIYKPNLQTIQTKAFERAIKQHLGAAVEDEANRAAQRVAKEMKPEIESLTRQLAKKLLPKAAKKAMRRAVANLSVYFND